MPSPKTSAHAGEVPDLDVRPKAAPRPKPAPQPKSEPALELAVDPRELALERTIEASVPQQTPATGESKHAPLSPGSQPAPSLRSTAQASGPDIIQDARALAAFGDPPRHWLLSATYAWRVLKRQHDLSRALVIRRQHAARAEKAVEDALRAIATRVLDDRDAHGVDFDAARDEIAALRVASKTASYDVTVHEAARKSYDARSLRQGLWLLTFLVMVFVVAPVLWRAMRVVEPPLPAVIPSSSLR